MIPLYSSKKFISASSRKKLPLECEFCHKTFYAKKNNIQWALKRTTQNSLRFCSTKCRNKVNDKRKMIPCHFCKKITKHKQRGIKNSKFLFCSTSCSTTYWNAHKTWGSSRSKLEIWIEKQLSNLYPNLHIDYNKNDVINSELDIYIPSIKLAFELNGIFHYEPIFGEDKLSKTQNNDRRKFQACLERGIELCIIDTHNLKYLKKERDQKFLEIITRLINKKVAVDTGIDPDAL
jgi:hypothetical protein